MPWGPARTTTRTASARACAHLLDVRATLPHLHAASPTEIWDPRDPGVLLVVRRHPLGPLLAASNMTDREAWVAADVLHWLGLHTDGLHDALTGAGPGAPRRRRTTCAVRHRLAPRRRGGFRGSSLALLAPQPATSDQRWLRSSPETSDHRWLRCERSEPRNLYAPVGSTASCSLPISSALASASIPGTIPALSASTVRFSPVAGSNRWILRGVDPDLGLVALARSGWRRRGRRPAGCASTRRRGPSRAASSCSWTSGGASNGM